MISRSEIAIDACDGDQYLMILMAAQRTREISQGATSNIPVIDGEKPGSTAVREIEAGAYTVEDYKY